MSYQPVHPSRLRNGIIQIQSIDLTVNINLWQFLELWYITKPTKDSKPSAKSTEDSKPNRPTKDSKPSAAHQVEILNHERLIK